MTDQTKNSTGATATCVQGVGPDEAKTTDRILADIKDTLRANREENRESIIDRAVGMLRSKAEGIRIQLHEMLPFAGKVKRYAVPVVVTVMLVTSALLSAPHLVISSISTVLKPVTTTSAFVFNVLATSTYAFVNGTTTLTGTVITPSQATSTTTITAFLIQKSTSWAVAAASAAMQGYFGVSVAMAASLIGSSIYRRRRTEKKNERNIKGETDGNESQ